MNPCFVYATCWGEAVSLFLSVNAIPYTYKHLNNFYDSSKKYKEEWSEPTVLKMDS